MPLRLLLSAAIRSLLAADIRIVQGLAKDVEPRHGYRNAKAASKNGHSPEIGAIAWRGVEIESPMTTASRRQILEQAGLLHPRPEAVSAPLFDGREPFFLALDKVQVKYEMLRAHVFEGLSATAAAERHGYSRAAFYLITSAFDEAGMRGLLDEPRGRRGPLKLTPDVTEFIASSDPTLSGAQLALKVEARFGVSLHRRTVERARR